MKKYFFIFLLLFSCSKVEFPWYDGTLEDALFNNNGKLIMLDFYTTW